MGFGDGFSSSKTEVNAPTKTGGELTDTHQFTGSVYVTSEAPTSISASHAITASYFKGDGSALTNLPGGGGGGGISWDGSTANGVATFKDSDEATVESHLTFDGSSQTLTLTGTDGGTAVFNLETYASAAFVISGGVGQYDAPNGLLFAVNTNANIVHAPAGLLIDKGQDNWWPSLGFGTGTVFSDPEAGAPEGEISHDGYNLILSGNGGVKLTSSIIADQIQSGSLAGPGSYIGLDNQNMLILTSAAGGGGGGGGPAGGDTQIQYNDGGDEFGGISSFTWDGQSLKIADDIMLKFGTGGESHIVYKETSSDRLFISGSPEGTVFSSSVYFSGMAESGERDAVSLDPDDGKYVFKADGSEHSGFFVSGTAVITGSAFGPGEEDGDGTIFRVEGGGQAQKVQGNPILYCQASASAGLVGISTGQPKVELDVWWNQVTALEDDTGGGEVVSFGTSSGPLAKGALYYLNSDGGWMSASAHGTGSGNDSLLGIALDDGHVGNPDYIGMLIRGWFHADAYFQEDFVKGKAVYIASGSLLVTTARGKFSSSAPAASDSYVRIVGHASDTENVIYFNPSSDWVELN